MSHTVDVNENVYTITALNRRKEAVNALERALEASWTLSDFVAGRCRLELIERLQVQDCEGALVNLFPAIDKTAKKRRPKEGVGKRTKAFLQDEEALIKGKEALAAVLASSLFIGARTYFARCPNLAGIRYSGVLAPTAAFRPMVVPRLEVFVPLRHAGCPAAVPDTEPGKAGERGGGRARNYTWAQLMMRVFELDVLVCPRCGGRMRLLAAIDSPEAIRKILSCLDLPTRPLPIAPAMLVENMSDLY